MVNAAEDELPMQSRSKNRRDCRPGRVAALVLLAAAIGGPLGLLGCVVSEKARYEQHLGAVVQPSESSLEDTVAMFDLHALRQATAQAEASGLHE
jgi:hypothetical protein